MGALRAGFVYQWTSARYDAHACRRVRPMGEQPMDVKRDPQALDETARRMRRDIVSMIAEAGSGHPGGSLSAADIVATLYFRVMRHDPADPTWPGRDRFVLSKGHAAPVLYAALAEAGYFGREHLTTLRKLGSILQGHPDKSKVPGVEVSTGSLGQGLAIANGIALGLRLDDNDEPRVYVLMGDGELQEGEVWEAAMFAAHERLSNLTAIVDDNGLQIDGSCDAVMCLGEIAAKFKAFGWLTVEADGNDIAGLVGAFETAEALGKEHDLPVVIVAHTTKGKGVSFMEDNADWHGRSPNPEELKTAMEELA
jgi:transketolase